MNSPLPTVLMDVTAIPPTRAGVGRYVDALVAAFDRPVFIACRASDAAHYGSIAPLATILPQHGIESIWRRLLWEQFVLPGVARRAGAQVIHSPHYTMPVFSRLRRVVTFHDATFFSDPKVHVGIKGVFFRAWIRLSRRLATAVIVPSAATASELDRFVPQRRDAAPYVVIHHGVDPTDFRVPTATAVAEISDALDLGEEWIAFLGTVEPRKNLPQLLKAYSLLARDWDPSLGPVPTLALAGAAGWGADLAPDIAAVDRRGTVKRVGYIDLAQIHAFLGGARLVVYPSLGEGFGLPVLEAMACGAPVLTTRRLALPEVGGDAVAYSDVDAASIQEALRELLTDPDALASLSSRGLVQAAKFTWQACATAHIEVFDRAAA